MLINMPIQYHFFTEDSALVAWVTGKVTFKGMNDYSANLVKQTGYHHNMNSFYDLTNCNDIDGDLEHLSLFAAILNNHEAFPTPCKTAILLPQNNEKIHRIVRGLILMVSRSNIEHRYFAESERGQAYDFVDFNPDLIFKLENHATFDEPASLRQPRQFDTE